jgi:Ca-activated chloride channel family protein
MPTFLSSSTPPSRSRSAYAGRGPRLAVVSTLLSALISIPGAEAASAKAPPASVSPTHVLAEIARHNGEMVGVPPSRGPVDPAQDRTLAPYLAVQGAGDNERLPLKETQARVSIAGVIARVEVHQVFANEGKKPIEAIYVFPASTRAAVHGMRMKIGGRTIEARIDRRAEAREAYETARKGGQRASLLEQERPNVFTMNVANVMPGDRIAVDLDYSELLVPEDGVYSFVYPTVVGPRYGGGADPTRDQWIANPTLPAGQVEPYRFGIDVHVEGGMPIAEMTSPSHAVKVAYLSPERADVTLVAPRGGNRDFILRYRLAGERINSGVLLWEGTNQQGEPEKFFAVMVEPPRRPVAAQMPPREYVFLLDVSGSMHGFPLDTAKVLMRQLLGNLRTIDSFNVVLFSGAAFTLSRDGSLPATTENVKHAMEIIQRQQGGGGTELMGGLENAYRIPRRHQQVSRTVVVVTDGFVGVEAQAFRFVRERLGETNLFAFGIGSSVNRGLIEGLARAGQGEPFVVLKPEAAAKEADRLRDMIATPVLTRVKVSFNGFAAREVAPAKLPDLLAQRPLIVYGKYEGTASGRVDIDGENGAGRFHQSVQIRPEDVRPANQALRWLWARKWVELLDDERVMGGGTVAETAITQLGLDYTLLTAFTSFVAVDSQVVNQGGASTPVRQALPMPEGVSNLAVRHKGFVGQMPHAPAPASPPAGLYGLRGPSRAVEGGWARGVAGGVVGGVAGGQVAKRKSEMADADEEESATDAALRLGAVHSLSDTNALVTALEAAIRTLRGTCPALNQGTVRVRLAIDVKGKVISVTGLLASPQALACLRASLVGLTSATHATVNTGGTVEVTL